MKQTTRLCVVRNIPVNVVVGVKEITICKRNDPNLSNCLCSNINRLTPLLKNGAPEMNILPFDPEHMERIQIEFKESADLKLAGALTNVDISGLSTRRAEVCQAFMTPDGIQLYAEFHLPKMVLKAHYKGGGKFMQFHIDTTGEYNAEYSGVVVKSLWNTTRYFKDNREYLNCQITTPDLSIPNLTMYFTNVFPNSTELTYAVNGIINDNIDSIYNSIKPVILQVVNGIGSEIVKNFFETFSFAELFPEK